MCVRVACCDHRRMSHRNNGTAEPHIKRGVSGRKRTADVGDDSPHNGGFPPLEVLQVRWLIRWWCHRPGLSVRFDNTALVCGQAKQNIWNISCVVLRKRLCSIKQRLVRFGSGSSSCASCCAHRTHLSRGRKRAIHVEEGDDTGVLGRHGDGEGAERRANGDVVCASSLESRERKGVKTKIVHESLLRTFQSFQSRCPPRSRLCLLSFEEAMRGKRTEAGAARRSAFIGSGTVGLCIC